MHILITALIIVASVLLILIVLVQNPKGGGFASNFSSSTQMMGVKKTADFLEKATWTLAISLVVLSVLSSITIPKEEVRNDSVLKEQVNSTPDMAPAAFPTEMPEQTAQPEANDVNNQEQEETTE